MRFVPALLALVATLLVAAPFGACDKPPGPIIVDSFPTVPVAAPPNQPRPIHATLERHNTTNATTTEPLATDGGLGQLLFAHVLFRHGDRNPVETYKTDPWASAEHWPEGYGQLTPIGKSQHYELGAWLRRRYAGTVVRPVYNESDIYVRSTDFDRTLQSAAAAMAGLYAHADTAGGRSLWQSGAWMPVPVHTVPQSLDRLLLGNDTCPRYEQLYADMVRTHVEPLLQQNRHLVSYLEAHSGQEMGTQLWNVAGLWDTLYVEQLRNRTLPAWTRSVWPGSGEFRRLADQAFVLETRTPALARLKYGWLLREMLERMRAKAAGQLLPDRSVWAYSGHDTTLAGVLNTLGLFEVVRGPPYASAVLLELRLLGGRPHVQVLYRRGCETRVAHNENEAEVMVIPMCGTLCPLERMFELYAHVLPTGEYEEECRESKPAKSNANGASVLGGCGWLLVAGAVAWQSMGRW